MDQKPLKAGFMSRLDYGGRNHRVGLWELAREVYIQRKTNYNVLVGGLVDAKAVEANLKELLRGTKKDEREAARKKFLKEEVDFLKENFPSIPGVKTYIVTSPAYDGAIGETIAQMLSEVRSDILLYRAGSDRLELKQIGRILGIYAPKKNVWMRGDYYDTPVLRALKDERKRSTRGIGDINAVGCFAAALFHPGDSSEIRRPYFALPGLSKVDESRTSENQIGVVVVDFASPNPKEVKFEVFSFKDLLADEWSFVETPDGSSKVQKAIIDSLRKRGPLSVGSLQDFTGYKRREITAAISELSSRRSTASWPGIVYDKPDRRYYLNMSWFRDKMHFKMPKEEHVDSFAAFGCMHGGCRWSDMLFMRDTLPELILKNEVDTLVGVGDFIEGLNHDLMLKNEICTGSKYVLNYSKQEKLSAYLVGSAVFKVFKVRMGVLLKGRQVFKMKSKELTKCIKKALVKFVYIPGNHCGWVEPLGFDSLGTFRSELKAFLLHHINKFLEENDLCSHELNTILQSRLIELVQNERYELDSGLPITLLHPSMSRTKTTSIRPQEMLHKAEDTDSLVVFGANFHVSEVVHHWDFDHGQRVCLQLGTLKIKSGFEEGKLKTVDFGVGFLKVGSGNKRILRTETTFYCTPTKDVAKGNAEVLKGFDEWLEINK